ncbi:MAG: FeoA family protein [Treponema sp.]
MTLDELEQGKRAVIKSISVSGVTLQRLISLGFTPETEVEVIRKAPLLDPFDILICGSMVAVRKAEAAQVEVEAV